MLFSPSQDDVRRFFCSVYAKASSGQALDAIETIASHWIDKHPEYHGDLANLPAGCAFADRCPMAQDACRTGPPPAVQITPDHLARCLRLDAARELP